MNADAVHPSPGMPDLSLLLELGTSRLSASTHNRRVVDKRGGSSVIMNIIPSAAHGCSIR